MSPTEVVEQLKRRLTILAASATEQVRYLEAMGPVSVDELALDLDDTLRLTWIPIQAGVIANEQLVGARQVNDLLHSFSGRHNAELWTYEALASADEWAKVRVAAKDAILAL